MFVKASESKLLAVKQKFIDDGFPAEAAEKYLQEYFLNSKDDLNSAFNFNNKLN